MGTSVGPFDGRRARRTRCEACAKRKIKCGGGSPCDYCKRTKQPCVFPARLPSALVFVGQGLKTQPIMDLDRDLSYFFNSFLPMNAFSKSNATWQDELQLLLHQSPALSSAVSAIAAFHRGRQQQLFLNTTQVKQDRFQALQSYGQSVRFVRVAITSNALADPAVLWSTFFLALFELMRDSTGMDWLSHFLNGTCAILCLQNPAHLLLTDASANHMRNFFFTTRIFEIARALIFSQPTFLSEPDWTNALSQWWSCEEGKRSWHPKEALFDKLPLICDLSIRTLSFTRIKNLDINSELHHLEAQILADEGLVLQQWLQQWRVAAEVYEQSLLEVDPDILVAKSYYHAISIYLSGTYDYHSPWKAPNSPLAPILERSSIEAHMHEILRLSQIMLDRGLTGLLLFIPLRIAGARVSQPREKSLILQLLQTISQRGYAVANAIYSDLVELWA